MQQRKTAALLLDDARRRRQEYAGPLEPLLHKPKSKVEQTHNQFYRKTKRPEIFHVT
jgi:hypothetical protein